MRSPPDVSLRKLHSKAEFIPKILTLSLFLLSIITAFPDAVENATFDTRVSPATIRLVFAPPPPYGGGLPAVYETVNSLNRDPKFMLISDKSL